METLPAQRAQIREFFERPRGGDRKYKALLQRTPPPSRLLINIADIRRHSPELADALIDRALSVLPALEEAASEIARAQVRVGVLGALPDTITPRGVTSSLLGRLLCLEGIITGASQVRPKIAQSVHLVSSALNKEFLCRDYRDAYTLSLLPISTTAIPKYSAEGNKLRMEYGHSTYTAHQELLLQEMPETAPAGQLARGLSVSLEGDLCGRHKPGDRVRVWGVLKCVSQPSSTSDPLRTAIIATYVQGVRQTQRPRGRDCNQMDQLSIADVDPSPPEENDPANPAAAARKLLGVILAHASAPALASTPPDKHIALLLSSYIAPSIYGHAPVKKALLLLLAGGCPLEQGPGRVRGDINVLLIGDPGVAKSQILKYALLCAPLGVYASGRGATGVGLTAAVVQDSSTNYQGRRIEAGAMVLADTGLVCVDEFEKMDDSERAAIHEAMEQQTVTVRRGGLHATLNARCSLLAAANPVAGKYRESLLPRDNIRLPESLLSRFDLVFILRDTTQEDGLIAEHLLSRRRRMADTDSEAGHQHLIREYISHIRKIRPALSDPACDTIKEAYARIRGRACAYPERLSRAVTPRALESLIRLATAHARVRASETVTREDALEAVSLLESTLWRSGLGPPGEDTGPASAAAAGGPVDAAAFMERLFEHRENNQGDRAISLKRAAEIHGGTQQETLCVLKELEAEGVLMVEEGWVVFS